MADIDTYVTGPGGLPMIRKDPNAILDYPFDWTLWLSFVSDTIASVVWILDASLTKVSSSFTTTTATAFISGGTLGSLLNVTCRITTAGGRTEDRTIVLKIVDR